MYTQTYMYIYIYIYIYTYIYMYVYGAGKAYFDPAYRARAYTEVYMEEAATGMPSTYFEIHEWDPLDVMHRQMLRNALVAQVCSVY